MQSMLRQAQKMQEDMAALQEELNAREYTATAGGGAVRATVDGTHTVRALTIQKEVVDPEDAEMLADLVMAAVNEAIRQAVSRKKAAGTGREGNRAYGFYGGAVGAFD